MTLGDVSDRHRALPEELDRRGTHHDGYVGDYRANSLEQPDAWGCTPAETEVAAEFKAIGSAPVCSV